MGVPTHTYLRKKGSQPGWKQTNTAWSVHWPEQQSGSLVVRIRNQGAFVHNHCVSNQISVIACRLLVGANNSSQVTYLCDDWGELLQSLKWTYLLFEQLYSWRVSESSVRHFFLVRCEHGDLCLCLCVCLNSTLAQHWLDHCTCLNEVNIVLNRKRTNA